MPFRKIVLAMPTKQYNLGFLYLNGLGVKMDYDKAITLFKKAAEQGDESSKAALKKVLLN